MTDTNENKTVSPWKKTTSLACIAVGGLLITLGNFFSGSLDLSAGLVQIFDAVAAILGAFGIGTLAASKSASADKNAAESHE